MRIIETDGDLQESEMNLDLAHNFAEKVWGQGFPYPTFNARFRVENQYAVGEKHLKLKLRKFYSDDGGQKSGHLYESMLFFQEENLPETIDAVYRLNINKYGGNDSLQLILEHWVSV